MKKLLTLALIVKEDAVLLGMKKRGFGAGQWNGFGGKVESGESVEAAALREITEEVGLEALDLQSVGRLEFSFAENDLELEVRVFKVEEFTGVPQETDEMLPAWFSFSDIPYDSMWPDDVYWLPLLLAGKNFSGKFYFDRPASADYRPTILEYSVTEV